MTNKVSAYIICTLLLFSCTEKRDGLNNLQPLTIGFVEGITLTLPRDTTPGDSLQFHVNYTAFPDKNNLDTALYYRQIDGAVVDYIDAIRLQASGIPVEIVMDIPSEYYLVTSIGSGIRTPAELRGRNIAVSRNTVTEYITDRMLQRVDRDPAGVNKADIRNTTLRMDLLQNGLVDATVLHRNNALAAMENGNKLLVSAKEAGIAVTGVVFTDSALYYKPIETKLFAAQGTRPPAEELKLTTDWLKQKNMIK